MAIILEGFDNSGKSTLARKIRERYGFEVHHAGPAPKDEDHMRRCLNEQYELAKKPGVVLDRATAFSHAAYDDLVHDTTMIKHQAALINEPWCVVVYCRPPERTLMDFSSHQEKDWDTDEHLEFITKNAMYIIRRYDVIMHCVPHLFYDWTDDLLDIDTFVDNLAMTQRLTGFKEQLLRGLTFVPEY